MKMRGFCSMEDRISHLPDHVLHEILFLLSDKDATKTSILSKQWNSVWNSFPILVIDQHEFRRCKKLSRNSKKVRENFCDTVDHTMQRRYENSIFTERLDISIYKGTGPGTRVLKHLDSWIDRAVTMKLNQLILVIYDNQVRFEDEQDYVLPQCVWNSQWLRVLELEGCEFSGSNMSGMVGIGSSLRELRLHHFRIDESTFHHVISSCFHLEDLWITWCVGFKVLNVVGLKGIHTVGLHLSGDESVFIEAPGLQCLRFDGHSSNLEQIIEASFLKKLKEICLVKMDIKVDKFDKFIPEFSGLEKLELNNCKLKESFSVSSGRLMSFSLIDCVHVRHIKLDTCCLNKLKYSGHCQLDITWIKASDEVKIKHDHGGYYPCRKISFDKIAMYLVNLSFCKVLTLICGESKWNIASWALDGLSCNIEKLRIKITKGSSGQIGRSCRLILEQFLPISRRPSSVLIELWGKESLDSFVKLDFLYKHEEINKGQPIDGNCACGDSSCWRCCLGELQISQSVHAMRGRDAKKLVEFFKANALRLKKINVESKAEIHSQAFDWCLAPQMKTNGPPRHLVLRFQWRY